MSLYSAPTQLCWMTIDLSSQRLSRVMSALLQVLNRLLRPLRIQIVMASSLTAVQAATDLAPEPEVSTLPDGAAEYLRASNPRLIELASRYSGLPGSQGSRWTAEFVDEQIDLARFRADNPYVWSTRDAWVGGNGAKRRVATRPINYVLSAYYARTVDELDVLDTASDDGLFGSYRLKVDDRLTVSRDLLDSTIEINFLARHCRISQSSAFKLIDVGAGYGRFAHRLLGAFPRASVYCVDGVPLSTFLCEYYLRVRGIDSKATSVPLDELGSIPPDIDFAVNIHSWSECPLTVIEWWLDRLVDLGLPTLMVVPNEGAELRSLEVDGRRLDFAPALDRRGYSRTVLERKYGTSACQRLGVFPTYYHLFERADAGA